MNTKKLKKYWKSEEQLAHIHGWDFSHIEGRYIQQNPPWDYKSIIFSYLKRNNTLLDIDTGGGEFLLSLNHSHSLTSATEGYSPNVELCKKVLLPLGINFRESNNYSNLPFENDTFDIIINRHGNYDVNEIHRILKPNGIFITQQVGEDNDREFIKLLLPDTKKTFNGANLCTQKHLFMKNGFSILQSSEAFCPMKFYDIGALVWFAKIIEWEFPNFSVDTCFKRLLKAQEILNEKGFVSGTAHRYLIVAKKSV